VMLHELLNLGVRGHFRLHDRAFLHEGPMIPAPRQ
jgi:hypothetical protein